MKLKKAALIFLTGTMMLSGCGKVKDNVTGNTAEVVQVITTVATTAAVEATTENKGTEEVTTEAVSTEAVTEETKENVTKSTESTTKEEQKTTKEATSAATTASATTAAVTVATTTAATVAATQAATVAPTQAPVPTVPASQSLVSTPYTPVVTDGMSRSPLTGEWITPTVASRRPFAVMLNNIRDAIPQSGIHRAEVLFEAYVEGNITRLMMVTQNYDGLTKIGSLRSCREFYIFFAKEYEATYVHFGRSPLAVAELSKPESNSMDGNYGAYASYRTTDRVAPHNAFTTTDNILAGMTKKGISATLPAGFTQPLNFNQDDASQVVIQGGRACTLFKPGFKYNNPELRYNPDDGLYYRYQFGAAHCDLESGIQLAFKNIIVKYVDGYLIDNYTPMLNLEGSGSGLFITNGAAADITWRKDSKYGQTKYYYPNGEEIVLNQGKVMQFAITNDNRANVVVQ